MTELTGIDALRERAKEIGDKAAQFRQGFRDSANEEEDTSPKDSLRLAHYTSVEAIISMLQVDGGGLRLSDSSTMNDPEEGQATRDGRAILHQLEREFGKESWLWKRYGSANVCCFVGIEGDGEQGIDAGNDLLFWRLYGNECRGVSIAMDSHKAQELVDSAVVQRVVYADEPRMVSDIAAVSSLLEELEELHQTACEVGLWDQICDEAIPECDLLMAQRFLWKRSHYEMEREYRAVAFTTEGEDNASEDSRFSSRGLHVQYGRICRYVQVPVLNCESILTTGSQITIGSNVANQEEVKGMIARLVESLGRAPNVVGTQVSGIRYRQR